MDEIEKVRKAVEGPLVKAGYRLYEVRIHQEKDGLYLSIVVDRDDPIGLDDIVEVSGLISPLVDAIDPLAAPYTLDISSLGAEKPLALERLEHYVNRHVALHLSHPLKGENNLEGDLEAASPEELILTRMKKGKKETIHVPRQDVDKARLAIRF